jgi:hypothetical protein
MAKDMQQRATIFFAQSIHICADVELNFRGHSYVIKREALVTKFIPCPGQMFQCAPGYPGEDIHPTPVFDFADCRKGDAPRFAAKLKPENVVLPGVAKLFPKSLIGRTIDAVHDSRSPDNISSENLRSHVSLVSVKVRSIINIWVRTTLYSTGSCECAGALFELIMVRKIKIAVCFKRVPCVR